MISSAAGSRSRAPGSVACGSGCRIPRKASARSTVGCGRTAGRRSAGQPRPFARRRRSPKRYTGAAGRLSARLERTFPPGSRGREVAAHLAEGSRSLGRSARVLVGIGREADRLPKIWEPERVPGERPPQHERPTPGPRSEPATETPDGSGDGRTACIHWRRSGEPERGLRFPRPGGIADKRGIPI